jgi:hypothetical protein
MAANTVTMKRTKPESLFALLGLSAAVASIALPWAANSHGYGLSFATIMGNWSYDAGLVYDRLIHGGLPSLNPIVVPIVLAVTLYFASLTLGILGLLWRRVRLAAGAVSVATGAFWIGALVWWASLTLDPYGPYAQTTFYSGVVPLGPLVMILGGAILLVTCFLHSFGFTKAVANPGSNLTTPRSLGRSQE